MDLMTTLTKSYAAPERSDVSRGVARVVAQFKSARFMQGGHAD